MNYNPQLYPIQQPAPNLVLSAIADLVRSKVGDEFELKPDHNNNITLIVRDGLLSFQLTKVSDNTIAAQDESTLYMLWNGTVTRNNSDQNNGRDLDSKLVHASVAYLLNWIGQHLNRINTPNYVQHSYAKGIEAVTRTAADVEPKTGDALDQAVEDIKKKLMSGEYYEDGDEPWDAEVEYRNIVKTFPKDAEPEYEPARPSKTNVTPTSFKRDGVVNFAKSKIEILKESAIPPLRHRRNSFDALADPKVAMKRAGIIKGQI